MGAYTYVAPRVKTCMMGERRDVPHKIAYVGRPASASTASGFARVHTTEQERIMRDAFKNL